ncbi:anthranilate phosphoribosyltransferase [Quadrisphaera sp. DSM 44207]|uniref:anthranilate phosphoribosyltransferase n=1 Tax=Quadrisphaera sp. DSM 44207 TaxID=1881057 RepID=UPI00087EA5F5|nr:anthranilate phosphoribosyltransferase [Quadrisphaera sp. DSM 44207]SDQ33217.1 anthranilate phosphoribosyltransferase [Quadrisphaera sp. DSM 44207]
MTGSGGGPSWAGLIAQLIERRDLTAQQAAWAMSQVMAGEASPARVAGLLVALRAKGETVPELAGLADAMLEHAVPVPLPPGTGPAVDVVGTGGDRAGTVNISTMAALVVAGAGCTVVKHGNRAASSLCGSADLLEELGVRLDLPPARVGELVGEVGITFCFAQVFHPAMRHAAAPRRELGIATAFNFLGPLTNPARPAASAIGVADARMAPLVAGVLAGRGARALVFRGDDGLDELTTSTGSRVWRVRDGDVAESGLHPDDLGLPTSPLEALRGGDAPHNAGVARALLAGRRGPVRDAVLLNAAAALAAASPGGGGLVGDLRAGLERAAQALDSGAAAGVLERWVAASRA